MGEKSEVLTDPVLWRRWTKANLILVPGPVEVDCSINSTTDHLHNSIKKMRFSLVLVSSDGAMFFILTVQPPSSVCMSHMTWEQHNVGKKRKRMFLYKLLKVDMAVVDDGNPQRHTITPDLFPAGNKRCGPLGAPWRSLQSVGRALPWSLANIVATRRRGMSDSCSHIINETNTWIT